jgi:hypothetical protein
MIKIKTKIKYDKYLDTNKLVSGGRLTPFPICLFLDTSSFQDGLMKGIHALRIFT